MSSTHFRKRQKASKIPEYVGAGTIKDLKKKEVKFNRPFKFLVDGN